MSDWYNAYLMSKAQKSGRQVFIWSLQKTADNIDAIKQRGINLISIRSPIPEDKNSILYRIIDEANLGDNICVIIFDDIVDDSEVSIKSPKLPAHDDISYALQWAKRKMKENNNDFVIHCTAGISRSSAIATLVNHIKNEHYGISDDPIDIINPYIHSPNERILEIGEKIVNAPGLADRAKNKIREHDLKHMNDPIF